MGGGGGRTTTESRAEYPQEFKPLARSAVSQIQALQRSLPLTMFTEYQPAGTAGLSPLQQYAIDELVPATTRPTAGLQGMLATPESVGVAAQGVTGAGEPTQAANAALQTLGTRLAGSAGQLPSLSGLQQAFAQSLPGNYQAEVFPGAAPLGPTSGRPTPILGGPGVTSVTPTESGAFPDPYVDSRPAVNHEALLLGLQLSEEERALYEGFMAQGQDPQSAFRQVINRRVRRLTAPQPPQDEGPYGYPPPL